MLDLIALPRHRLGFEVGQQGRPIGEKIGGRECGSTWREAEFIRQLEAEDFPRVYLDGYLRSGWDAPGIKIAFSQFLAGRFLPPEEESFRAAAKTDGHDHSGLLDELKGLGVRR